MDRVRRFFYAVDQRPVLGPLVEVMFWVCLLTVGAASAVTVVLVLAEVL